VCVGVCVRACVRVCVCVEWVRTLLAHQTALAFARASANIIYIVTHDRASVVAR
jgi:hypothetical protein